MKYKYVAVLFTKTKMQLPVFVFVWNLQLIWKNFNQIITHFHLCTRCFVAPNEWLKNLVQSHIVASR